MFTKVVSVCSCLCCVMKGNALLTLSCDVKRRMTLGNVMEETSLKQL